MRQFRLFRWVKALFGFLGVLFFGSYLFADSNFEAESLTLQGASKPSLLYRAALMGYETALIELTDYAQARQSSYWLELAASLSSKSALYELGQTSQIESEKRHYFTLAAQQGHQVAQFQIAMLSDGEQREYWLLQAARQGLLRAQVALYEWYSLHHNDEQSLYWMTIAAEQDEQSAFVLAQRLWNARQFEDAQTWMAIAAQKKVAEAKDYLALMRGFWPDNRFRLPVRSDGMECGIQLQPVATSLSSMRKIRGFISRYQDDKRLSGLSMCFNDPIWVEPDTLSCSANWRGSQRLGCNLNALDNVLEPNVFTHLLVVADRGKANVNQGVIYLDLADNYHVLVHELAHLVGFIDEYPLSSALAEQVCYAGVDAPNLVIVEPTSDDQDLAEQNDEPLDISYWQQFELPIRVSASRTCNNHALQAFKPSGRLTFMEYYDTEYIPPLYIAMWQSRIDNREGVVPAYLSIARGLEDSQLNEQSQRWWEALRQFNQQVVAF